MMVAEYLGKCRLTQDEVDEETSSGWPSHGFTPDSVVIVSDSDVLINSSPEELIASLEGFAANIKVYIHIYI
jgi:hypothetical protein